MLSQNKLFTTKLDQHNWAIKIKSQDKVQKWEKTFLPLETENNQILMIQDNQSNHNQAEWVRQGDSIIRRWITMPSSKLMACSIKRSFRPTWRHCRGSKWQLCRLSSFKLSKMRANQGLPWGKTSSKNSTWTTFCLQISTLEATKQSTPKPQIKIYLSEQIN